MTRREIAANGIKGLLRAYASILFTRSPWTGLALMTATFVYPNTALAGLLAALAGMATASLLRFPGLDSGLHIYNSLLTGLALGAYYQLDAHLAVLVALSAILAVFATIAAADMLWRLDRLPALSLPFVGVALTATLAAHSYGTLSRYLSPLAPRDEFLFPLADQFLTALGSAFFTPHPIAGFVMFIALLIASRYLAMLAVAGFLAGHVTYAFLSGAGHESLAAWNGFNFILTAVALGGIFTTPGKQSFLLAMVSAMLAAMVTAALETFMLVYGLPVMALPFLGVTLLALAALRRRPVTSALQLLLESPGLPEENAERARLARVRSGELGSVPLLPPFHGRWDVYQGFMGEHTHTPPWQHALDFHIQENDKSFRDSGNRLEDYFCFGLPVLAPADGEVVAAVDDLPDNPPGRVDMERNWGNHVLLRMNNGMHVLLAHLKQGSVRVNTGQRVHAGETLAQCGSSGRSPQPHLHLHVQQGAVLGEPTHPFHLSIVMLEKQERSMFHLHLRPEKGERIRAPELDSSLAAGMELPVGREWRYRVRNGGRESDWSIRVGLDLVGGIRLQSSKGGSISAILTSNLLAMHGRDTRSDPILDAWALALGLTPFVRGDLEWRDEPPQRLFPLSARERAWALVVSPLGGGISSFYVRTRKNESWLQEGRHVLRLPALAREATTRAWIESPEGCVRWSMSRPDAMLEGELTEIIQRPDAGVPGWIAHA